MSATDNGVELGMFNKVAHANFCLRCLYGLPATMAEADSSRIAVGFYCLGALDILGLLGAKLSAENREAWRTWIWAQQVTRPRLRQQGDDVGSIGPGERNTSAGTDAEQRVGGGDEGAGLDLVPPSSSRRDEADKQDADDDEEDGYIGGFRPGPFMHVGHDESSPPASESDSRSTNTVDADPPHLIMTYTALLALAILRDDFAALDRRGLVGLLRATQKADGSFSAIPGQGEADIRMVYTAFAICAMLDDWRGVDVPRALAFVRRCASYEGGFGQAPGNEAQGGPTYCALATLALAPPTYKAEAQLSREERRRAERWLVQQQQRQGFAEGGGQGEDGGAVEEGEEAEGGGFGGRTEKDADACYSFWCGAALRILRSGMLVGGVSPPESERGVRGIECNDEQVREEEEKADFVERLTHARFLSRCQFRLGGLAKAPGAHPDPYHTYLALAALSLYPPYPPCSSGEAEPREEDSKNRKERERESWILPRLDPLINATVETARWARARISGREQAV